MTGPLNLPSRALSGALDGLGSLGETVRHAVEFQRELLALLRAVEQRMEALPRTLEQALRPQFEGLDGQIERLPKALEETLRHHFDAQRDGIESLNVEFVRNRESADSLPPRVDALLEEMQGLRSEVATVRGELAAVRDAVELLREPAERVARINDRLPGSG